MRDDLPDVDAIRAAIREENLLGIGGFSSVYAIDGHPDYVVKIITDQGTDLGNSIISDPNTASFDDFKVTEDHNFKGRNFGQPVAQYFEDGDVQILLRQKGIECGVPVYLTENGPHKLSKAEQDKMYFMSLKRVAAMPQSAYVQLFQDAAFLGSIGYRIDDAFSENLFVDIENGHFNPIDLRTLYLATSKAWSPRDIDVRDIYLMLCCDSYNTLSNAHLEQEGGIKTIILNKVLAACEELALIFMHNHPEDTFYGFDFYGIAGENSQKQKQISRRILALHGTCEKMPTKMTVLNEFDHYDRWKTIFEEATDETFPVHEQDIDKYEVPLEEFSL